MAPQILIMDFGSQYTQLIARRVRELNVYCEINPYNHITADLSGLKGVILSGSPCSVSQAGAPNPDLTPFRGIVPVLGICYGAQLLAYTNGGEVRPSGTREYGRANFLNLSADNPLFAGIDITSQIWMSHGDTITEVPQGADIIASTTNVNVAAFKFRKEDTWGIQFHPEVTHSTEGVRLLNNFVIDICGADPSWTPDNFVTDTVSKLKEQLGNDKVILGLSGGVDSSVAAALLHKAIGQNLHCIFVNNGLLRYNEYNQVLETYKNWGLNVKGVDASALFYAALDGISDPEAKRKAIGKVFIDVFDKEAQSVEGAKWLAQGTIYPDVIESVSVNGPSATIKSHHNVGGLPDTMKLKVVEPLRALFKDEVRRVGHEMQLDINVIDRHPFPGPGLAIRILGAITPEKIDTLQKADAIFIDSLKAHNLYKDVWQAGVILLPVQSVGVMGDERTYENAVALRAVTSIDGMSADWAHLPYSFLADVSNDIINKVKGINRVVYDISSKPPATIEWE